MNWCGLWVGSVRVRLVAGAYTSINRVAGLRAVGLSQLGTPPLWSFGALGMTSVLGLRDGLYVIIERGLVGALVVLWEKIGSACYGEVGSYLVA